jgi:COP9 signalosome complex subunit 5
MQGLTHMLTCIHQIDPNRTISAGRVDIGAFRTFPPDYKPPNAGPSEYQTIPLNKIEDFGAHANSYYPLKVEHFKSSLDTQLLDMLWNKYWASTLAQSPVVVNRSYTVGQLDDLAEKLRRSEASVSKRGVGGSMFNQAGNGGDREAGAEKETKEEKVDRIMSEMNAREADAPLAKAASDR